MVLYLNIVVGQRVVVRLDNKLVNAVVRFKGTLNGQPGRWVGVELEVAMGTHNGLWRGNQYFKCPHKHGLFTHACNIGFRGINRKSRNQYKTKESADVEEELFGPVQSCLTPKRSSTITKNYLDLVRSYAREGGNIGYKWSKEPTFNLSHSVGSKIPCATISKEPVVARKPKKRPDYFLSLNGSIPHYRMPHETQLDNLRKGRFDDKTFKQPRFLSV